MNDPRVLTREASRPTTEEKVPDVLPKLARGVFTNAELAMLTPAAWKKARAPADVATPPPA